MKNTIQAFRLL